MTYVILYLFLFCFCILHKNDEKKLSLAEYYKNAYIYIYGSLYISYYKKLLFAIKTFHKLSELIDMRIVYKIYKFQYIKKFFKFKKYLYDTY